MFVRVFIEIGNIICNLQKWMTLYLIIKGSSKLGSNFLSGELLIRLILVYLRSYLHQNCLREDIFKSESKGLQ
jgi:hypothetical protein